MNPAGATNAAKIGKALAERTRKAQGLPSKIRDREIARAIAALLLNGRPT